MSRSGVCEEEVHGFHGSLDSWSRSTPLRPLRLCVGIKNTAACSGPPPLHDAWKSSSRGVACWFCFRRTCSRPARPVVAQDDDALTTVGGPESSLRWATTRPSRYRTRPTAVGVGIGFERQAAEAVLRSAAAAFPAPAATAVDKDTCSGLEGSMFADPDSRCLCVGSVPRTAHGRPATDQPASRFNGAVHPSCWLF